MLPFYSSTWKGYYDANTVQQATAIRNYRLAALLFTVAIPKKLKKFGGQRFMGILPEVKCVCPSCFEEIFLGECRIMSGRTTGKVLKNPPKGWRARMNAEPLDGREYTLELARRECTACGYLLPSNIEIVPSITLAVAGDTFSGKSHYIAALIQQIKADWMVNASGFARFTCLTPEVERTYTRDYFEPLFNKKQTILPTLPTMKTTADPLIYKLVVSPSPRHLPTAVNLMIYDTSGEDYVSMGRLVQFARFVLNTSAFIFVADPCTMDPILKQLPPVLQQSLRSSFMLAQRRRAVEGLVSVIDVFERYHGYSSGAIFSKTPVAVMLSKADLLKSLPLPNNYHFMTNSQYRSGVDMQDINIVDQEVRNLLEIYQQGNLLAATKRFKSVKFFATSATGEPPDLTGRFTNVEPCRCLDPVLWILYQLGIIKNI